MKKCLVNVVKTSRKVFLRKHGLSLLFPFRATTVRFKGRNLRIKAPMCRALKKLCDPDGELEHTRSAAGHVPRIQSKQTLVHSISSAMIVRRVGGCGWSFGNNKSSMWAPDISMVTMWEVRRSWKDTMENLI